MVYGAGTCAGHALKGASALSKLWMMDGVAAPSNGHCSKVLRVTSTTDQPGLR